ncbi:hypothetical protein B0A48_18398 [Cryoendolithus antarcticus]|uniref:Uncharacterized protein n=1 Tax=Cryoendolithus antarcticus TaxID=1507870 RepID=A0A1V8S8H7_9PEZI|nr:hypothetical protein B0A48_18398 [Cryoendolithus antarcticus]
MISLKTFVERLQVFDFPGKETNAHALFSEAKAREEPFLSALDQAEESRNLDGEDARERKAKMDELRADTEVLRYRFATTPGLGLSAAIEDSAPTLLSNARTFYKGAMQHDRVLGDKEIVAQSSQRSALFGAVVRIR